MEESQTLISDEELESINFALSSRYGIDFTGYEPVSIKRRIARIIYKNKLGNIVNLWQKLLYDQNFAIEFKDEISVGLTEMFRNPMIWSALKQEYLPKLAQKDEIKIWHAGCSTGEEYYTMSIVLKESGLLEKSKVMVTDLSDRFIAIAQKGEFEVDNLNNYTKNYREYNPDGVFNLNFEYNKDTGTFLNKNRPKTIFKQHNLASNTMDEKFDIIFCRNVMIYFNDALKMNVLKSFHSCLNPNGLFIIGHFDAMPIGYDEFFDYYDPSLKFFTKK